MPAGWDEQRLTAELEAYQEWLDEHTDEIYLVAEEAKALGKDFSEVVEIPRAADLAGRTEKLLEEYLDGMEIETELRQLLLEHEDREETAIEMATRVAKRMHARTKDLVKAIDTGLRVGLAILTEAVLVAPLEGIGRVQLLHNEDGSQFVSIDFCGPIRAAGGTAQALAVLIADVLRRELGVGAYKARFDEVERVKEEFGLYRGNLQYRPPPEEIEMIVPACPVMVNGESTENIECSGYRDLENIEGNRVRGGVVLVIGEGLCLKAPKVQKHTERLQVPGWEFITHFANKGKDGEENGRDGGRPRRSIKPNSRFMDDIIAGRPVFGEPSKPGGFRLRYGRTRATGLAAGALNAVTMHALGEFLAVGTQMKIERPGKACAVTPSDDIEGPWVLFSDGNFGRIDMLDGWNQLEEAPESIWDNGELMLGYGEFLENNKPLVPSAYNRDWWAADIIAGLVDEDAVTDLAQLLGLGRSKLPEGVPVMEVGGDAVKSARSGRLWSRFLRDILIDWEVAKGISARFQTAVPSPWNLWWADLPLEWTAPLREQLLRATTEPGCAGAQDGWREWNPDAARLRLPTGSSSGKQIRLATARDASGVEAPPDRFLESLLVDHGFVKSACMVLGVAHIHDGDDLLLLEGWEGLLDGLGLEQVDGEVRSRAELIAVLDERLSRLTHSRQLVGNERLRKELLGAEQDAVRTQAETAARQRGESIAATERAGDEAASEIEDEGPEDEDRLEAAAALLDEHQVDSSLWLVRRTSELRWENAAPVRIGARMARPEKAAHREMKPAVHALFPIATEGGPQRLLSAAAERGSLRVQLGVRECVRCGRPSPLLNCHHRLVPDEPTMCGGRTLLKQQRSSSRWRRRGEYQSLPLPQILESVRLGLGLDRLPKKVKCVKGLISAACTPEPLEKGVLRARHGLPVFRDGTIRFDMSDVPVTHFRPCEIGTPWERLKELCYTHDIDGEPLTSDEQMLELYPQDMIPSRNSIEHLISICVFIDDLLTRFYGLDTFYSVETESDLVGQLAIGLAPHTSGGVLCRIIGFTNASGGYAHTLFHAAKRRNCDGDEDSIMLLLDGLLNFSRDILPANRGGRMDAPLVLTTRLNPTELDKEALNVDCAWFYDRRFFEATLTQPHPKELADSMDYADRRIGSIGAVRGYGFTHGLDALDSGPKNSAYKILDTMVDKMNAQLELGARLRSVDVQTVASLVVEGHFFPDLRGNLIAFTRQKVRCGRCAYSYRRLPLAGKCIRRRRGGREAGLWGRSSGQDLCGGNLIMTVSEGAVRKYVKVAQHVMETYDTSEYTQQKYGWLAETLDGLFANERIKVYTLDDFV